MLISNLTESVFCPTLSNTSRSTTSPVGRFIGCCCCSVVATPPKSRGIGGKFLLLAGECDRRGESSGLIVTELLSSAWTVGAFDETLKNEDDPLLCVAPNAGPPPPPPDGRPGSSFSFSFSFPFTLVSPVRSLSLRLMPNDSFDALRTIRLVVFFFDAPATTE